jgi:hypothetical protein
VDDSEEESVEESVEVAVQKGKESVVVGDVESTVEPELETVPLGELWEPTARAGFNIFRNISETGWSSNRR